MGEADPSPLSGCQETVGIGRSHSQRWGSRLQEKSGSVVCPYTCPLSSADMYLLRRQCVRWKMHEGTSCLLVTRLSFVRKVSLDFYIFHNVSQEEKVIFIIAGMRILLREEAALWGIPPWASVDRYVVAVDRIWCLCFSKLVGMAEKETGWEVLGNPVTSHRLGEPKVSS